jgi:hypothetical protein
MLSHLLRARAAAVSRLRSYHASGALRQALVDGGPAPPPTTLPKFTDLQELPAEPSVPYSDPRIAGRQVSLLFENLPVRVARAQQSARVAEATAEVAGRLHSHGALMAHALLLRQRLRPTDVANPARFAHQLPPISLAGEDTEVVDPDAEFTDEMPASGSENDGGDGGGSVSDSDGAAAAPHSSSSSSDGEEAPSDFLDAALPKQVSRREGLGREGVALADRPRFARVFRQIDALLQNMRGLGGGVQQGSAGSTPSPAAVVAAYVGGGLRPGVHYEGSEAASPVRGAGGKGEGESRPAGGGEGRGLAPWWVRATLACRLRSSGCMGCSRTCAMSSRGCGGLRRRKRALQRRLRHWHGCRWETKRGQRCVSRGERCRGSGSPLPAPQPLPPAPPSALPLPSHPPPLLHPRRARLCV